MIVLGYVISGELVKAVFCRKLAASRCTRKGRLWCGSSLVALLLAVVGWMTVAHYLRVGPYFGRYQVASKDLQGLPLELISVNSQEKELELLAILITGDGGWAAIDQRIAAVLSEQKIPTVGWIAPRYFWQQRTPAEMGRDLARVMDHFTAEWHARRVVLIGYSRGACVLPFMVNRLPEQNRSQIAEIALLGPSTTVSLQMQPIDYLWRDATAGKLDVLPEMTRLAQDKVFCICGDDEPDSLCRRLDPGKAVIVTVPGGHHFGGDYEHVADLIIRHARSYREQAKSPVQPETGESPKPPDSGPTNVAVRLIGSAQLTIR